MIFRDDDISVTTSMNLFKEAHDHFIKAGVTHTVAMIVKDIEQHTELVDYINANDIDVEIHCWEHYDLCRNIDRVMEDLPKCIETIQRVFGQTPDTLFPPWNRSTVELEELAESFGLKVSRRKISIKRYVKYRSNLNQDVISFHYWSAEERGLIERALEIYKHEKV